MIYANMMVVFMSVLQILFFFMLFSDGCGNWMRWFYFLILCVVDVSIFFVLRAQKEIKEKRKKLSVLYQQREKELQYYEHVTAYLEQMRMVRHEFVNQMQVVYDMLENDGDMGEIYRLLDQMNEKLSCLNTEKNQF